MDLIVKQESMSPEEVQVLSYHPYETSTQVPVHDYYMSDGEGSRYQKKRKLDYSGVVLHPGFLDLLPPLNVLPLSQVPMIQHQPSQTPAVVKSCKQFWKAGDYEVPRAPFLSSGGLNRVRVHPKFLHSNATSHKWALGAFAELLDNSVDEICNGATYVNVDMLQNKKDGSKMLLVQDNGGGMSIDTMRHCISFGYSAKSKIANTIGRYGNGFKTSTMRLGADVIVFSRCLGKNGKSPTQSIGMLSYTFLRSTGKDDIVVPILDYERREGLNYWNKIMPSSVQDWNTNLESIVQWSPYSNEADLLEQFSLMDDQGTRVVIYNLWEDEQGNLELDFDTDSHDIQIRGVNRDETMIEMAKKFPSSKHFLTYRHSLRSYTSILYLRLPPEFRIVLRGEHVEHHNMVDDMMLVKKSTYKPLSADGVTRNSNTAIEVKMGFVKDAKDHIDVQGFNVYHKNRLITPFWRVWNAAGSGGRGVIGVLEANFVEPAHDKQGFENTPVLRKLQSRLADLQRIYWRGKCHEVGYAPKTEKGRAKCEDKYNSQIIENHSMLAENKTLKERLAKLNEYFLRYRQSETDKFKNVEAKLKEKEQKIEELVKEADTLFDAFSEERNRRDKEEACLRNKVDESLAIIQELRKKVTSQETMISHVCKQEIW